MAYITKLKKVLFSLNSIYIIAEILKNEWIGVSNKSRLRTSCGDEESEISCTLQGSKLDVSIAKESSSSEKCLSTIVKIPSLQAVVTKDCNKIKNFSSPPPKDLAYCFAPSGSFNKPKEYFVQLGLL